MKKGKLNTVLGMGLTASLTFVSLITSGIPVFAAEGESDEYIKTYHSNGVIEFIPNEGGTDIVDPESPDPENPVSPVDPTDPDGETDPGTSGPLSIDFASSLDFGQNKISNKDEIYYANPQYFWNTETGSIDEDMVRPNYVQVTDNRGTNGGWTLRVKEETQLRNENTLNQELTGAEITFINAEAVSSILGIESPDVYDITLIPGETSVVMTADEGAGAGTWIDRFGTVEEVEVNGEAVQKNTAISLSVPGSTAKDAVEYKTELTWTLTDAPGNSFDGNTLRAFTMELEESSTLGDSKVVGESSDSATVRDKKTSAVPSSGELSSSASEINNERVYSPASNSVNYHSNGVVSFIKGEDDSAEENDFTDDGNPEGNESTGTESGNTENSEESGNENNQKENDDSKGKLPQTGEKSSYLMSIGGILLISLLILIKNRKKLEE